MLEHQTQPSSLMWEISNVLAIIVMKQDDDKIDREINNDQSEDLGQSTLSSHIEEDDLDIQQEVLHLDQAHHEKTIQTTRDPPPKKWSHANTVIARTPLPSLRHPAWAIVPALLKRETSVINISRGYDIVQGLPLRKAGGDYKVPQYQKATFELVKQLLEAVVFTLTPWPFIADEKYSMVDEAWKPAIKAQDPKRAVAGVPLGTPSVWELSGGPSLNIDPQTREAVSRYSSSCSSIGRMRILNLDIYIVKTKISTI